MARRSRHRRRNPRELNPNWIVAGVFVAGGWLLYKVIKGILDVNKNTPYEGYGAVGTAANAANSITGGLLAAGGGLFGRTLYDWINPGAGISSMTYYKVYFPGNVSHAIGNKDIKSDNTFTYSGVRYKLTVDSAGTKFAVPL